MSVTMESETMSDEETETASIRLLHDALEADQASRRAGTSTQSSVVSASTSCSQLDSNTVNKVESALAFNKLMDNKLKKLENILTQRLTECRKKLMDVQIPQCPERNELLQTFKYVFCGNPYFKDHSSSAPDNRDTITIKKSGMYDTSSIISICGWTIKDKRSFTNIIMKLSIKLAREKLHDKLKELENNKTMKPEELEEARESINSQIDDLGTKSLAELALPIEEEYDWAYISFTLNSRHSPQEYRALWKLFLHPSINKHNWTKDEKAQLQEIAKKYNLQDWDKIATELGTGRTGYQCFVYHRTNLENQKSGQKWTQEEEEYLKRLLEYYKEGNYVSWAKIASKMPNRTKMQIYTKYIHMTEKKGRFLKEEDAVLLTCVKKYGPDYKMISKILKGRSHHQLRRRYDLLTKSNRVSCVWTVDEDRRLLQLMTNKDDSQFADLVKVFPGKTRVHLRTRYKTLISWMQRHPRLDIALAPRRGARRLGHGHVDASLPGALETLKRRIEANESSDDKQNKKITSHSTEIAIEDAIVAALVNEELNKQPVPINNRRLSIPEVATDTSEEDVQKVLILLKARLNKEKFTRSKQWLSRYPGLLKEDFVQCAPLQPKVVSYSKKTPVTTPKILDKADIWGMEPLTRTKYVLPPTTATLAACRRLMACAAAAGSPEKTVTQICHKNAAFRALWLRLLERFQLVFTWPLMISNDQPSSLLPSLPTSKTCSYFVVQGAGMPQYSPEKVERLVNIQKRKDAQGTRKKIESLIVDPKSLEGLPSTDPFKDDNNDG